MGRQRQELIDPCTSGTTVHPMEHIGSSPGVASRTHSIGHIVTKSISMTLGVDLANANQPNKRWVSDSVLPKMKLKRPSSKLHAHEPADTTLVWVPAHESFFDVFGVLGVPMIAAFVTSAAALVNQAYIQMYPAQYVNLVMNTSTLDSGDFWMMPEPEPVNMVVSVIILLFFAGCYLVLILYAVFFRHRALAHETSMNVSHQVLSSIKKLEKNELDASSDEPVNSSILGRLRAKTRYIHSIYAKFSSLDGVYNKYNVSGCSVALRGQHASHT